MVQEMQVITNKNHLWSHVMTTAMNQTLIPP